MPASMEFVIIVLHIADWVCLEKLVWIHTLFGFTNSRVDTKKTQIFQSLFAQNIHDFVLPDVFSLF
jgi:hypothetical protein